MGRIAANNLNNAIKCFFDYNAEKAADVRNNEETVNILNHSIADAMLQLKTLDLTTENMRRVSMMTIAVTDIERLSDHAENIVEYIEEMNSKKASLSESAMDELKSMAKDTIDAVSYTHLDVYKRQISSTSSNTFVLKYETGISKSRLLNSICFISLSIYPGFIIMYSGEKSYSL